MTTRDAVIIDCKKLIEHLNNPPTQPIPDNTTHIPAISDISKLLANTTITLPEIVRNLPTEPASDWEGCYASVEGHDGVTYALGNGNYFYKPRDFYAPVRHNIPGAVLRSYVAAGLSDIQIWGEPSNEGRVFVLHEGCELDLVPSGWMAAWIWQTCNRLLLPLDAELLRTYRDGAVHLNFENTIACPLLVKYCDAQGDTQHIDKVDAHHEQNIYPDFERIILSRDDLYAYGVLPNNAPEISLVGGPNGEPDALICYFSDGTRVRLASRWNKRTSKETTK